VKEAIRCREENKEECILFSFSGHGLCDLGAYDRYFAGDLQDFAYPQDKIEAAIAELPAIG
jgi:tryptophan synthase beta chain